MCDPRTNGELFFLITIMDNINVIFDVGCSNNSDFIDIEKEVHYFDPNLLFIEELKTKKNRNKNSYFNAFGLHNKTTTLYYYPRYQSLFDRIISCSISDDQNKIEVNVKNGKEYLLENNITDIDFLKIDTEGNELNVLGGFEELLNRIKIIQFEYGGTYLDSNIRLNDVVEYLKKYNFNNFYYIMPNGLKPINDYVDHYGYSNIIAINDSYYESIVEKIRVL